METQNNMKTEEFRKYKTPMRSSYLSLRSRMAISFSILFSAILVLVCVTWLFGIPFTKREGSYGRQQSEVFRNLSLVADLKKERLLIWLEERQGDLEILSRSNALLSYVKYLENNPSIHGDFVELTKDVNPLLVINELYMAARRRLETKVKAYRVFRRILIADPQSGTILVSTDEKDLGSKFSNTLLIENALKACDKASVMIQASPSSGKPYMLFARALIDPDTQDGAGEKPLGVVIMYINAEDFIKPLLYTGGGLGVSGDIILVTQDVKILITPKYPLPNGKRPKPLLYEMNSRPAKLAATGQEGITQTNDYRNEPVLAAYRHVKVTPTLGLGMVVKVDQEEVFAPLKGEILDALLIGIIGVLGAAGLAVGIAAKVSEPIHRLSSVAKDVEAGNLEARAPVARWDEVGRLAHGFNLMIDRVQNWHNELEELVKIRTQRLNQLNKELAVEIEERKTAEDKIHQQNVFLNTVVESITHPFYVIDTSNYMIILANSAATMNRIAQHTTCYSLTHDRSTPCTGADHPCPLEEVKKTNHPCVVEHVHFDAHGNPRNFEVHAHPIFDKEGNVEQLIEYSIDITERKQDELERERLIEQLEVKNAELERFTYTVSHDLSSPLITIKTFAGFINEGIAEGNMDNAQMDLKRITNAADKMSQLLEELLELSRIGRMINPSASIPFEELANEAVELLQGVILSRGIDVRINQSLPCVYGDHPRLLEVVQNLLDNAIKFMGDQSEPVIEIGIRQNGGEPVFYVRDNGIGIDPDYQHRIFGLFEKLDSHSTGTGIGLALVKRIVEVHKGKIWLESEGLGHGSTFCFTLPTTPETHGP